MTVLALVDPGPMTPPGSTSLAEFVSWVLWGMGLLWMIAIVGYGLGMVLRHYNGGAFPTFARSRPAPVVQQIPADDPDAGIVTYQAVLDLLPADVRDALTAPLPMKKGKRR